MPSQTTTGTRHRSACIYIHTDRTLMHIHLQNLKRKSRWIASEECVTEIAHRCTRVCTDSDTCASTQKTTSSFSFLVSQFFPFIYWMCLDEYMHAVMHLWSRRTTWRSHFSLVGSGIEPASSGLAARVFATHLYWVSHSRLCFLLK